MKIRIGVSACFFHSDPRRPVFKGKTLLYLEQSMAHWIASLGAIPYLIPTLHENVTADAILEDLDGLILQAGSDVCPRSYGEEPMIERWSGDHIRDQYEIAWVKRFMEAKKPILGICRGEQLLNVALGGTLYQDIASQVKDVIVHRDWNAYDRIFHEIEIQPGSRLAKIYPDVQKAQVNTVHHQAIKDLAPGLVVEAKSTADGIIEAVRLDSNEHYVLGVQWHPEFHRPEDTFLLSSAPLLQDFIHAVKKQKKDRL